VGDYAKESYLWWKLYIVELIRLLIFRRETKNG
jgi:hypothetical protein